MERVTTCNYDPIQMDYPALISRLSGFKRKGVCYKIFILGFTRSGRGA